MIAICVYQYIIHFSSDQTEWYCQNQQTDYDAEDYHGEHDVKHIMRSNTLWGQIHYDALINIYWNYHWLRTFQYFRRGIHKGAVLINEEYQIIVNGIMGLIWSLNAFIFLSLVCIWIQNYILCLKIHYFIPYTFWCT
jgi:hypothetical protein